MARLPTEAGATPSARAAGDNVGAGIALTICFASIVPFVEASVKLLGETTSAPQIVWARFLFQTLVIGGFLLAFVPVADWRPRPLWPLVIRGALITCAAGFLYAGLAALPLADTVAIFFVQPLILTLLSRLVLKDRVGWHRWGAVVVGLAGALMIIGPNFQKTGWPALLPALAATCYAVAAIITRRWSTAARLPVFQFYTALTAISLVTVAMAIGWRAGISDFSPREPTSYELALLLAVSVGSTTTNLLLTQAYRVASPSVIAPFLYLHIVGAAILGAVIFDQLPGVSTALGALLVIGAGLFVWWRETRTQGVRAAPT